MISKLYRIGCVKGCDKSPNAIIQATIISKLLNSTPTKNKQQVNLLQDSEHVLPTFSLGKDPPF